MKKKFLIIFMLCAVGINIMGCSSKKNKEESKNSLKEINICTDSEDDDSLYLLNYIKNQYESSNPQYRVNINNIHNLEGVISSLNENKADLVVTNRNTMIELAKKGFIAELSKILEDTKIKERYYDIINYYGMYGNKSYGLGVVPFPIEIIYNKSVAEKMKLSYPKDINGLYDVLKKLNEQGIKVPVILPKDIQLYQLEFSTIFNNTSFVNDVEEYYDSVEKYYDISQDMQKVFQYIDSLYKRKIITSNTFQRVSPEELKEIDKDRIPLMIVTYNGRDLKKNEDIYGYDIIDFGKSNFKNPVIVKPIICVNNTSGEKKEVKDFIKFIYSDEFQKKLYEQGFYTGNVKLNKEFNTKSRDLVIEHISYSNKRSMFLNYNIPYKINKSIENIMLKILQGKYSGEEWKDIIKKAYK